MYYLCYLGNTVDAEKPFIKLTKWEENLFIKFTTQGKILSLSSQTDFDLFTPDIILTPDGSKDENVKYASY